jgi:hypothetical protein
MTVCIARLGNHLGRTSGSKALSYAGRIGRGNGWRTPFPEERRRLIRKGARVERRSFVTYRRRESVLLIPHAARTGEL